MSGRIKSAEDEDMGGKGVLKTKRGEGGEC